MKFKLAPLAALAILVGVAHADTLVTTDGSTIIGTVIGIDNGKLTIDTAFAGEIEIDQSLVASIDTDEPIYITLDSGSTYLGDVQGSRDAITVHSQDGQLSTELALVQESWLPGNDSPTAIRQAEAMEKLKRAWAFEAAFDLTGKSGNSESNGLASSFRALLKGPDDQLEFAAKANFEDADGVKSADDAKAGVFYSNNFGSHYNWYVRSEFGYDAVKDIELLFTTAAGLGYIFSDNERRNLRIRGGFGYLFEAYDDVLRVDATGAPILDTDGDFIFDPRADSSSASLDLGLSHQETLKWGVLTNRLTYTPTINDFGNFRFVQDSNITLPLKSEAWSVRVGLTNKYDSEANLSNKEELDTIYYIRMVLNWL